MVCAVERMDEYRMARRVLMAEVSGMPLHDAVGINCKKGRNYTENQGSAVKYIG